MYFKAKQRNATKLINSNSDAIYLFKSKNSVRAEKYSMTLRKKKLRKRFPYKVVEMRFSP
jgi:hypothetical protein